MLTSLSRADYSSNLMPAPAQVETAVGSYRLNSEFRIALTGAYDDNLKSAVFRGLRRWEERSGLVFDRSAEGGDVYVSDPSEANLTIDCSAVSPAVPVLGEDESYTLLVEASGIKIEAATTIGAQRALETLSQLLQSDSSDWFVSAVKIWDEPRFPWRGLMIDVCRHWQPIEVIKRNIDGMALVKLNVLHLHLTEDQGFRIESKVYPKLHELGSDGNYFTQVEIKEIVRYAAERGIRVIPEFDLPGHASSWAVGHPELMSTPGPYYIERKWGVFDPTLDPTREEVYEFLDALFGEMTALFPDPYFHIGGDENNGVQWSSNERIQKFIKDNDLEDNHGLQAYFNRRLNDILSKYGKRMIGWDEIQHPDIPTSSIIQSWRGAEGLAKASKAGHNVILSNGYYIDLIHPAEEHYLNDPLPKDNTLSEEEQSRVLGGEATMWAEWVSHETIDSRIWPRTAAIAERLWSPRSVRDVDDMYRRLEIIRRRLSEVGLRHDANQAYMISRYAGDYASDEAKSAIASLLTVVEPVRGYERSRQQPLMNQYIPLTGLADCARPDSPLSRAFSNAVDAVIAGQERIESLDEYYSQFRKIALELETYSGECGPKSIELKQLATQLLELAEIGTDLSYRLETLEKDIVIARLATVAEPRAAVDFPLVKTMEELMQFRMEFTLESK